MRNSLWILLCAAAALTGCTSANDDIGAGTTSGITFATEIPAATATRMTLGRGMYVGDTDTLGAFCANIKNGSKIYQNKALVLTSVGKTTVQYSDQTAIWGTTPTAANPTLAYFYYPYISCNDSMTVENLVVSGTLSAWQTQSSTASNSSVMKNYFMYGTATVTSATNYVPFNLNPLFAVMEVNIYNPSNTWDGVSLSRLTLSATDTSGETIKLAGHYTFRFADTTLDMAANGASNTIWVDLTDGFGGTGMTVKTTPNSTRIYVVFNAADFRPTTTWTVSVTGDGFSATHTETGALQNGTSYAIDIIPTTLAYQINLHTSDGGNERIYTWNGRKSSLKTLFDNYTQSVGTIGIVSLKTFTGGDIVTSGVVKAVNEAIVEDSNIAAGSLQVNFNSCVMSNGEPLRFAFINNAKINKFYFPESAYMTQVHDLSGMFDGCTNLTQVNAMPTSNITCTYKLFALCDHFNQQVTLPSGVTDTHMMFSGATSFNNGGRTMTIPATVTNASCMFEECSAFNQSVTFASGSGVTNVSSMFSGCTTFAQNVDLPVSAVEINHILDGCVAFQGVTFTIRMADARKAVNLVFQDVQTDSVSLRLSRPLYEMTGDGFDVESNLWSRYQWRSIQPL